MTSLPQPPRPPTSEEEGELRERMRTDLAWLVQLRAVASVGVAAVGLLAGWVGWIEDAQPVVAMAGLMVLYNFGFYLWHQRDSAVASAERFRAAVLVQLTADISALTALLHFSGGVENPFAVFYVFHMAIGATVLDRERAWLGGVVGAAFYGALILGEYRGALSHYDLAMLGTAHPLQAPYRSLPYVFGHFIALTFALMGTIYFVRTLAIRHGRVEARLEEHKRVVATRERMARIGEISAGVAHAIRNPLHGLLNCVDILKGRSCGVHSPEILELMSEGMLRIQTITQRLLTLGADAPLDCRPASLADVIAEACEFVHVRSRGRDVRIHLDLQDAPEVPVDRNRLGEALHNIVDNALSACPPQGNVYVRLFSTQGPERALVIEVEDDGCGIPASAIPMVFHPFYTSKAVGEGTGLGLAISRRVVEEHGGTITVKSDVGAGTTVRIALPVPEQQPRMREAAS